MNSFKTSVDIEAVGLKSFVCPVKSFETSALKAVDREKNLETELDFKFMLLLSVKEDPAMSSGYCFLKFQ